MSAVQAVPRAPSPLPRPSYSSGRSRLSPGDFENALLNPNHTVFLSGSPTFEHDSPLRRRDVDVMGTPQRSFEEDMKDSSTPERIRPPGVGVVPPTPSTAASSHTRRGSLVTVGSTETPSRVRTKGPSVGLDAEIAAEQAKTLHKRKSLFRSPGTASSPDLATLMRKAKDRKPVPPMATPPPSRAAPARPPLSPERSRSYTSTGGEEEDGFKVGPNRGAADLKSMGRKARGVFGRMFGTVKEPSPVRTFPAPPTASTVPPIPAAFMPESEVKTDRPGTPEEEYVGHSLEVVPEATVVNYHDTTKALPETPITESRKSTSSHTRQPAHTEEEEESRPREREKSFTEDVAGMLADIGQTSPARELGLAPDSIRPRDRSPRLLQAELGRSGSFDRGLKSRSPVPAQRTSSLPSPNNAEAGPSQPRVSSSPNPSTDTSSVGRQLDFGSPEQDTVRMRVVPQLESPLAPSVRLVNSPKPSSREMEPLELTTEYLASPRPSGLGDPADIPSLLEPDEEDDEERGRRLACEFLENDFTHVSEDRVAMFLGGPRAVNSIALRYYMQYFDMKGQNLVEAFRELCAKLQLKAESQEIDRIIEGFSARYYDCNPTTIFGSPGVVHTVTGAMLMLNTDLHIADLSKHMSRSDFVRNAMAAIRESMPDGASTPDLIRDDGSSRLSAASIRKPTPRSASAPVPGLPAPINRVMSESVESWGSTYSKTWEVDAENALRDIFSAVRSDRILLPASTSGGSSNRHSMISLANSLDTSRKTLRSPSDRMTLLKRGSVRMNSPYGANFNGSDGRLSPTGSYANSINETITPFASIGFASNLTHTVIREQEDETRSIASQASVSTADELDDDELALLGAPWAKEGLLWHKLYWEAPGKRAKKNDWQQFFVVVQKGELHMFVFGSGSSGFMGGTVGGGNWLNNAKPVGTINLMHVLAVAMPKGSVSDRSHCLSVTAPSGQVTLFQAGTEDLVTEWVSACNYWSARRSRQPLAGGVSNMEYGWQRVADPSHEEHEDKGSIRSARSNLSKFGGTYGRKSLQPLDRVHINDWKPPIPASMPSPLDEEQQLEALQVYVKHLVEEVAQHKALEEPMIRQFSPGTKNLVKSRENWKARSLYLHTEIIKYDTYIDSLRSAISLRLKKAGEKKLEKSLARSMTSLHRRSSADLISAALEQQ